MGKKKVAAEEHIDKKKKRTEEEEAADDDALDDDAQAEAMAWWEQEELEIAKKGEKRWTTLSHNGVMFPPPYVPHGIPIRYDGEPIPLTPEEEEVATMFAAMKAHDYYRNEVFRANFFRAWRRILDKRKQPHPIKVLELCDFEAIYLHCEAERLRKKNLPKEEKKAKKKEEDELAEKYKFCLWDGRKERLANFRVEPPGLFRGRGKHPLIGCLKLRTFPEDITLNLGEGEPVPELPPHMAGHKWGGIVHNHHATWLATWMDSVTGNHKYVMLDMSSTVRAMSDKIKFEKARSIKDHIDRIRESYMRDLKSSDMLEVERAVAMYFIDKLALRVGNEKGEDEADTVGCCSLRVEHVSPVEGTNNRLLFDFLGKDSIRFYNEVEVLPIIYDTVKRLRKGKPPTDQLFPLLTPGRLNEHLKDFHPDLTAKVFRTYNASALLDKELRENPFNPAMNLHERVAYFNAANTKVALLCNHQRTVSKTHAVAMAKLDIALDHIKQNIEDLRHAKETAKKRGLDVARREFCERQDARQLEWLEKYGKEGELEAFQLSIAKRDEAGTSGSQRKTTPRPSQQKEKRRRSEADESDDEQVLSAVISQTPKKGGKSSNGSSKTQQSKPAPPPKKAGGKAAAKNAKEEDRKGAKGAAKKPVAKKGLPAKRTRKEAAAEAAGSSDDDDKPLASLI